MVQPIWGLNGKNLFWEQMNFRAVHRSGVFDVFFRVGLFYFTAMSTRGELIKEASRSIREARKRWNAHDKNQSCRQARDRALVAYEKLSKEERNELPEVLRVWLRYRSEKYFGAGRNGNGMSSKSSKDKKKEAAPNHAVAARKIMSGVGPLYILSSKRGICGLFFGHRVEPSTLPKDNSRDRFLNQAEKELGEYFEGDREIFEVVIDARGSQFQRLVWRQLSAIPFGETRGYGEIAEKVENPKAVRAVGTANGANPVSIIVPCHRVIGKDGALTGFGGGLEIKKKLLQLEGVLLEAM
jgi:methylated-DNA-[protein]-cysteine S-methyltransferase